MFLVLVIIMCLFIELYPQMITQQMDVGACSVGLNMRQRLECQKNHVLGGSQHYLWCDSHTFSVLISLIYQISALNMYKPKIL